MTNLPPFHIDLEFTRQCGVLQLFVPMDGLDDTGRSLLEGRSILYPPNQSDYSPCPIHGSRRDHDFSMNMGALRHFMAYREDTISWLQCVSRLLQEQTASRPESGQAAIRHFTFTAYCIYRAPMQNLLSRWFQSCREISPAIAIASKISYGAYELGMRILRYAEEIPTPVTAEYIYDFADSCGSLIGPREVCAASPNIFEDIVQFLIPDFALAEAKQGEADAEINHFAQNAINFGSVFWATEMVVMIRCYIRLCMMKKRHKKSLPMDVTSVTFPHGIEIFRFVNLNRPLADTMYRTFLELDWSRSMLKPLASSLHDYIDLTAPLLSVRPCNILMSQLETNEIESQTVLILNELSKFAVDLGLIGGFDRTINRDILELFFGNLHS